MPSRRRGRRSGRLLSTGRACVSASRVRPRGSVSSSLDRFQGGGLVVKSAGEAGRVLMNEGDSFELKLRETLPTWDWSLAGLVPLPCVMRLLCGSPPLTLNLVWRYRKKPDQRGQQNGK